MQPAGGILEKIKHGYMSILPWKRLMDKENIHCKIHLRIKVSEVTTRYLKYLQKIAWDPKATDFYDTSSKFLGKLCKIR